MIAEQLQAARAAHWRQAENPILTLDDAQNFLQQHPLCLYLPRQGQLPAPAPSFVEACLGSRNGTPGTAAVAAAQALLTRLVAAGAAVPLNLLGTVSEQPDFLAHADALPFVLSLRGDADWKHAPQKSSGHKISPLVLELWRVLEKEGGMSAAEARAALGRELTEAAVLRGLCELWQSLRISPVFAGEEQPARWEMLRVRHRAALTTATNTGQVTALSLLVSMYLQSVYAAASEEIEVFLSPVASRSRVREAVRGLSATRQIHSLSMSAQTYYFLENGLPEFAEQPEVAEPSPRVTPATAGSAPIFRRKKPAEIAEARLAPPQPTPRRELPAVAPRSPLGEQRAESSAARTYSRPSAAAGPRPGAKPAGGKPWMAKRKDPNRRSGPRPISGGGPSSSAGRPLAASAERPTPFRKRREASADGARGGARPYAKPGGARNGAGPGAGPGTRPGAGPGTRPGARPGVRARPPWQESRDGARPPAGPRSGARSPARREGAKPWVRAAGTSPPRSETRSETRPRPRSDARSDARPDARDGMRPASQPRPRPSQPRQESRGGARPPARPVSGARPVARREGAKPWVRPAGTSPPRPAAGANRTPSGHSGSGASPAKPGQAAFRPRRGDQRTPGRAPATAFAKRANRSPRFAGGVASGRPAKSDRPHLRPAGAERSAGDRFRPRSSGDAAARPSGAPSGAGRERRSGPPRGPGADKDRSPSRGYSQRGSSSARFSGAAGSRDKRPAGDKTGARTNLRGGKPDSKV